MDCIDCKHCKEQRLNFNDRVEIVLCKIKGKIKSSFGDENECSFYEDNDRQRFIKEMLKKGEIVYG